ncbi:hypothetical protein CLOP_g8715, partial [Closterium sp. NIES-67]
LLRAAAGRVLQEPEGRAVLLPLPLHLLQARLLRLLTGPLLPRPSCSLAHLPPALSHCAYSPHSLLSPQKFST